MAGARTLVLVGPTGVGKTQVALALVQHWPLEVVSADSRQVYRHLDIGTAKPTQEERQRLPHHGLDLVDPGERFSAGRFARQAPEWLADIRARGRMPAVVGGTGLYVRALADGLFSEPSLDPQRRRALAAWTGELEARELVRWAGRLDTAFAGGGRQRAGRAIEIALLTGRSISHWQSAAREHGVIDPFYVVLTLPRQVLHQRIRQRASHMVERGLLDEVGRMIAKGLADGVPGFDAVGIRETVSCLRGTLPRASLVDAMAQSTRQYAKRQETWFRHQLPRTALYLDAGRSPEQLAQEIVKAWGGVSAEC